MTDRRSVDRLTGRSVGEPGNSEPSDRDLPAVIANEFAAVQVEVDRRGNDDRLRITDARTGRSRSIDAFVLESLVWTDPEHWQIIFDPSHRWRDQP